MHYQYSILAFTTIIAKLKLALSDAVSHYFSLLKILFLGLNSLIPHIDLDINCIMIKISHNETQGGNICNHMNAYHINEGLSTTETFDVFFYKELKNGR